MKDPVVYDKAKWHYEADNFVGKYDRHQGFVHEGIYLGWCINNELISKDFAFDFKSEIEKFKNGQITGPDLFEIIDGVLDSAVLNNMGNQFTKHYYEEKYFDDLYSTPGIHYIPGSDIEYDAYAIMDNKHNFERYSKMLSNRYNIWKLKSGFLGLLKSKDNEEQVEEEDFMDLTLKIKNLVIDNNITFDAFLLGSNGGFRVEIRDKTSYVKISEESTELDSTVDGITIVSLGEESDKFLTYLARKYFKTGADIKIVDRLSLVSLAMSEDIDKIKTRMTHFKLFHEKSFAEDQKEEQNRFYEEDYFEMYFNIDIPNMILEFHEKDFDYRKPIIKALTKNEYENI